MSDHTNETNEAATEQMKTQTQGKWQEHTGRTYGHKPHVNSQEATVLTEQVERMARRYGLTDPSERSILLTLLYQLTHNNTLGWSLQDTTARLETLLRAARNNTMEHSDYFNH